MPAMVLIDIPNYRSVLVSRIVSLVGCNRPWPNSIPGPQITRNSGNLRGVYGQVSTSRRHYGPLSNHLTAILGLQGFFPLKGQQAVGVGSVEYPPAERKRLATL